MKEERFSVNMSKQEMIRFYANKIVEDGIRGCNEFSNIIYFSKYLISLLGDSEWTGVFYGSRPI